MEGVVPREVADGGADPLATLLLRHVSASASVRGLDLLESADTPPAPATDHSSVYTLVDMAGADPDEPLAAAVVTGPDTSGNAELRALTVGAAYLGRGLDGRLLTAVVDLLRTEGARRVLACVNPHANCDRLYKQAGFRPIPLSVADRYLTPPQALDSWYELEL